MNLRNIKKKITYELGAFLEDCSVVAAVGKKEAEAQIENLMNEAIELHEELRDKVNNVEGSAKEHFTKLWGEVEQKTDELYSRLSEAVKAAKK